MEKEGWKMRGIGGKILEIYSKIGDRFSVSDEVSEIVV